MATQRTTYLLAAVQQVREATGLPHWMVIDEAHYFFQAQSPSLKYLSGLTGSLCLVTYRPSLLVNEVYNEILVYIEDHHLIRRNEPQ